MCPSIIEAVNWENGILKWCCLPLGPHQVWQPYKSTNVLGIQNKLGLGGLSAFLQCTWAVCTKPYLIVISL